MKILGIDPGIGRVGWGVIMQKSKIKNQNDSPRWSNGEAGNIKLKNKNGGGSGGKNEFEVENFGCFETKVRDDEGKRLYEIHCFLKELMEKEKPDEVAVESLFFAQNVKTAMMVSQARGAILLTIAQAGLPAFSYTPLQVKQALTGYGRAEKKQVQKMVSVILGMDAPVKQDDAADALAVAVCHSFSRKLKKQFEI